MSRPHFDLYSIDYLKNGSERQRRAYSVLYELNLMKKISDWTDGEVEMGLHLTLAGSIPIDLATDESDLDVIVSASDLKRMSEIYRRELGNMSSFQQERGIVLGVATLITKFGFGGETFEIFTQNVPVPRQNAVIHLLVEERLLTLGGEGFRQAIMALRQTGWKTEPAFGEVLGLEEPYRELLELDDLSDDELRSRFHDRF
jgi:hypothetical protein